MWRPSLPLLALLLAWSSASGEGPAWREEAGTGRRYRVEKHARAEGAYVVLPDGEVRLRDGTVGVLERSDEQALWVRVYQVPEFRPRAPSPAVADTTTVPEALPPVPEVDRVRFAAFDAGLPRTGQWRNRFDIADLDGDGRQDIVSGPPRKAGRPVPVVYLGDGAGSWRRWNGARFPALPYEYGAIAAADLDVDGRLDLVLGMHLRGLVALRGVGSGAFEHWGDLTPIDGTGFSSVALTIVDFDGDGRQDVLALGEGPRPPDLDGARGLRLFRVDVGGIWHSSAPPQGALSGNFGRDLVAVDLDRNGRKDIVTATSRVGFRRIVGLHTTAPGLRDLELPALPDHALVEAVAAGDLDADGLRDLVVGLRARVGKSWRTGVEVHYGAPEGVFRREVLLSEEVSAGVSALDLGDVDGDGALDLAAGTGDGRLLLWMGAPGRLRRERVPELPAFDPGCACSSIRLVDLGGDARAELVAAFAGDDCPGGGSLRAFTPGLP